MTLNAMMILVTTEPDQLISRLHINAWHVLCSGSVFRSGVSEVQSISASAAKSSLESLAISVAASSNQAGFDFGYT